MNIAVLGAGAMGMLFGSLLSKQNSVWLIDIDKKRICNICSNGVVVQESNGDRLSFHPHAVDSSLDLPTMDLVIVFVKSMYTESALETNRNLLGSGTYLMTLQNGMGHEVKLARFVSKERIIIGSTQHNSSVIGDNIIRHGGGGKTSIGLLSGRSDSLSEIAANFTQCGLQCATSDTVKSQIWNKLFLNTSASSLTAVLQVPLGFIVDDPYACGLMEALAREAVAVANASGEVKFEADQVIHEIKGVLTAAKSGCTSICADIRDGRKTEVDTISGAVLDEAKRFGVPAPCHATIVSLIHALENKNSGHVGC